MFVGPKVFGLALFWFIWLLFRNCLRLYLFSGLGRLYGDLPFLIPLLAHLSQLFVTKIKTHCISTKHFILTRFVVETKTFPYKWDKYSSVIATCANNEFDILCLQANCNIPTTDEDRQHARDCVSQAQFFFANPDGFEHESAELLLTNGQHEPTLTIEADTWVRLRLGYMSTQNYLRVARHSNTLRTCWVRHN